MPRRIQRRRRMLRIQRARQLRLVLLAPIHRMIEHKFPLRNGHSPTMRLRPPPRTMRTRPQHRRLLQRQLHAPQNHRMQAIVLHRRHHRNPIAGPKTRMVALDHEAHPVLLHVPHLGLVVDRPCRMQLVLVDGDGRLARGDDGLGFAQEGALAFGADACDELVGDLCAIVEFDAGWDGFGDADGEGEVLLFTVIGLG